MVSQTTTVVNSAGLRVWPAAKLSACAQQFTSEIILVQGYHRINAKSMINILGGLVQPGTQITVECKGSDEKQALDTIIHTIQNDLEESSHEPPDDRYYL